ncbi:aspartate racemase [Mytilinidion resinicola]|uniref:Aspartate racemase n=1 Tax=Mytilinidion resinicola TaxID=574789 RepID=A0A6A6YV96_9PEZI|nr:aspartate racemase [Mytilinidion resinicola]KAF2812711.1 aspartate racemase [Mytilinidion resinicola]
MKTLGLLGGTSYPSTILYYTTINNHTHSKLGGSHSAPLLLHSFDFSTLLARVSASNGDWASASSLLIPAAQNLVSIGASAIVVCENVIHAAAPPVQEALPAHIPILHVVDAVGAKLRDAGVKKVGLLATKGVMEGDYYVPPLRTRYGLDVVTPSPGETAWVDHVIFEELGKGVVAQRSREKVLGIIEGLREQGAEAVVLACTDLAPLLEGEVEKGRVRGVRVYDSTVVHAEFVAEWAMAGGEGKRGVIG